MKFSKTQRTQKAVKRQKPGETAVTSSGGALPATQKSAVEPKIITGSDLAAMLTSVHHAIARRAYKFYEARGREDGRDWEDWYRAEAECVRSLPAELTDTMKHVTVRARLLELDPQEIKIGVQPNRVLIYAKTEPDESAKQSAASEGSGLILRFDLPHPVESSNASAYWADQMLTLELPKMVAQIASTAAV